MSAPSTGWSNARLVEACLKGDDRSWLILVDRYKNLVYSIALKFGAPHQDAADIFQAVWLELFNELPRLREPEALQETIPPIEAEASVGSGGNNRPCLSAAFWTSERIAPGWTLRRCSPVGSSV